jgi:hypothetical protein
MILTDKTINKTMTAVEWFVEQIKEYDFSPRNNTYLIEIPSWILQETIEQAKEMEKEQIIEAHLHGMDFIPVDPNYKGDAEQYYNETYKKEEKC